MDSASDAYDELYVYTMGRAGFILQHVVDAFGAQTASKDTKPIGVTFALAGLFLRVERQYSGRQVQQVHVKLAKNRTQWPGIPLPEDRGSMTAVDVLAVAAGPDRDLAIDAWCRSVWAAFQGSHRLIADLLREHQVI